MKPKDLVDFAVALLDNQKLDLAVTIEVSLDTKEGWQAYTIINNGDLFYPWGICKGNYEAYVSLKNPQEVMEALKDIAKGKAKLTDGGLLYA